jgi:hypothetical protein
MLRKVTGAANETMKRNLIIIVVAVAIVALGLGVYFLFSPKSVTTSNQQTTNPVGTLPAAAVSSTASNLPTGPYLEIGTPEGTVQINNFYASNPPVDQDGDFLIKQTANYVISYDPLESAFWLGITGSPFATWQSAAEQDFLTTLGVSEADACKLDVTSGVIYSPGNPNDGESLPLSFCVGGAFQK